MSPPLPTVGSSSDSLFDRLRHDPETQRNAALFVFGAVVLLVGSRLLAADPVHVRGAR